MNDELTHDDFDDDEELISKSQLKREAHALLELGRAIVALQPANLEKIPLDDGLRQAVDQARAIKAHGALKRQHQYIAKLLRHTDVAPIEAAMERIRLQASQADAVFKQCEQWRERLLNDGNDAMQAFIDRFPQVERQQLRQLVRNAQREQSAGKPPKSARELFRLIRTLHEDA
ncbi:ribosome biogenesis factor YjgA [Granulosicoccaceae sp. 1_MG-2023]|nr:ribosome biogenesis factor YjgA [Granulosicoccaceae sp. 1_MG-2023]